MGYLLLMISIIIISVINGSNISFEFFFINQPPEFPVSCFTVAVLNTYFNPSINRLNIDIEKLDGVMKLFYCRIYNNPDYHKYIYYYVYYFHIFFQILIYLTQVIPLFKLYEP